MNAVLMFVAISVASVAAAPFKDCNKELEKVNGVPLLGAFKPRCNPDGTYQREQCYEGYCYCVFERTGEKVLGTEVRFGRPKSCELTKCLIERHGAMKKKLLGGFQPQCDEDGDYLPKQCHHDGFCYCVNPKTGEKVPNTEVKSTHELSCDLEAAPVKDCNKELASVNGAPRLGAFKPKCNPDGTYQREQCHEAYCFCVFEKTGEKVLGTQVQFGHPKSCVLTKCVLDRHEAMKKKLIGGFQPQCDDNGDYLPEQCHHDGFCYCVVPKTGEKLLGTEVRFGHPESCKITKCVLEKHNSLKQGLLGAFKPECNPDGSYASIQCHETHCYCVFPTGEKVLGTTVRFTRPKSCDLKKCVLQRHQGWKQLQMGLLGMFVPQCDDNGDFKKMQCRKGMCWCVKPLTGDPIENSNTVGTAECK